jgi:hypothetical protein
MSLGRLSRVRLNWLGSYWTAFLPPFGVKLLGMAVARINPAARMKGAFSECPDAPNPPGCAALVYQLASNRSMLKV